MEVLTHLPEQPELRPAAVTFGNFDGVHVGHAALLSLLRQAADRLRGPCTVVTFDPHPLHALRPGTAPPAVDTLGGRLRELQSRGIDRVVVLRFDADLAGRSATWFARDALCDSLGGRAFVVGPDARFGHGGQGDAALLAREAAMLGGTVEVFGGVDQGAGPVSSSRVRAAVSEGDVAEASSLLGRPFCLRGTVVHGDAVGRTIGFATANLAAPEQVQPADGVYATFVQFAGQWHDAVTHVGARPTFEGARRQIEAHILDWQGDIYEQNLDVHFVARLRGVQRFADVRALQAQIRCDVEGARQALDAWRGEARAP